MKAKSFLALLLVIILTPVISIGGEESTTTSSGEDTLQFDCYELVSFHPEVMTDGNLTWIAYFEDVVVINELGDTVDVREGVGAHNIGWEKIGNFENLRLCRPNGLTNQWIIKIPLSIYESLILGSKLR